MNKITLVPVGGLGNRMRAIESGVRLSKDTNSRLKVLWFKDSGMGCRFDRLFCPIDDDMIQIKEASFKNFIYDRPRLKNLYIPYITENLLFDHCIYEKQSCFCNESIDFKLLVKTGNTYIASFMPFYENGSTEYSIFKPIPELKKEIDAISKKFANDTIGIQIRRTDNIDSIELSPTSLFIEKMKEEKNALFYLATDSHKERKILSGLFKDRIIFLDSTLNRKSEQGIQQALVELFILSRTKKIYGSIHSSFGEVASLLGNTKFEQLNIRPKIYK